MRALVVALVGGIAAAQGPAAAAPGESADAALDALFARQWDEQMRDDPEKATEVGDTRFNDRWADRSPAGINARQQRERDRLAQLQRVDRSALSPAQQLNLDAALWLARQAVERQRFNEDVRPVDHKEGSQLADRVVEITTFRTLADYRAYVQRLEALPALIGQETALMQEGLSRHDTPPRVLVERVPAQIRAQIVADPAASPFYRPFLHRDSAIDAAQFDALAHRARSVIADAIVPAYRGLLQFVTERYLPGCRTSVAASDLPDGAAYYAFLVRDQTTTDLSVDEIHALGLREVARLRKAMEAVKAEVGFQGTLQEFFSSLRSDPKYFYASGSDLLTAYQALAKRIDPELLRVFRIIPRQPYGVRPIPAASAPDTTTAYYQPGATDGSRAGYYYVNLYQPESRPRWEMMPLTLHEAVPGHHFQFARSLELPEAPMFRRTAYFVGYSEGWGLYAEQLGYDMGLYDDPYDRIGQLAYETWRAIRLVVDTGIHAKGWSRERAIAYFKDNSPKAELDIVNEIDRYIGTPGQALAYKIGQLKISELRERARTALGERFDLRDFNDAVLAVGSVPLPTLERHIDAWVALQRGAR